MRFNLFGRTFSFLAETNQQEKAIMMIEKYIFKPEVLIVLTILAIYLIAFVVAKTKKNKKVINVLKKISPWVYLLVILGITVLNRTPGDREIRLYHDAWFTQNGFHESNVLGFMFNLVLYIPYGWLLVKHLKNNLSGMGIIIITSLLIEVMQYVMMRGVTSIDDLVANTLGGVIGLGLAIILDKLKRQKME